MTIIKKICQRSVEGMIIHAPNGRVRKSDVVVTKEAGEVLSKIESKNGLTIPDVNVVRCLIRNNFELAVIEEELQNPSQLVSDKELRGRHKLRQIQTRLANRIIEILSNRRKFQRYSAEIYFDEYNPTFHRYCWIGIEDFAEAGMGYPITPLGTALAESARHEFFEQVMEKIIKKLEASLAHVKAHVATRNRSYSYTTNVRLGCRRSEHGVDIFFCPAKKVYKAQKTKRKSNKKRKQTSK